MVIFDIRSTLGVDWEVPGLAAVAIVVGAAMIVRRRRTDQRRRDHSLKSTGGRSDGIGPSFSGIWAVMIGLLGGAGVPAWQLANTASLRAQLNSGSAQTLTGTVVALEQDSIHRAESWTLLTTNGVSRRYAYSEASATPGYRRFGAAEGRIRVGAMLSVTDISGTIVRIELLLRDE